MIIKQVNFLANDEIISEDAKEITIQIDNRLFILRHRGDGVLILLTPDGGYVQRADGMLIDSKEPVRRTYTEPFAKGGLLIYQHVFDENE